MKSCESGRHAFLTCERYDHVMEKFRDGRWEEGRQLINNALRDFRALGRRAGVKSCTMHDLRRSCLTNWAREVPAHVLQKLAGHSSMETTLKYYHTVDRSDLERARRVGDAANSTSRALMAARLVRPTPFSRRHSVGALAGASSPAGSLPAAA
jgi:integrase